MADHPFGDVHRDKPVAVVHRQGIAHELRGYLAATGPFSAQTNIKYNDLIVKRFDDSIISISASSSKKYQTLTRLISMQILENTTWRR
jgi:hypothetical protein